MKHRLLMKMGIVVFVGLFGNVFAITQDQFNVIFPSLLQTVLADQQKINESENIPLYGMYYCLKATESYDSYAYSVLELSFPFFEATPTQIETWLKKADLDRINGMLAQCGRSPEDTCLRARVVY